MPKKKVGTDKKVSDTKHKRVAGIPIIKHNHPEPGITKKEFMDIIAKSAQPTEQKESDNGE
jgi:hypothetical protein